MGSCHAGIWCLVYYLYLSKKHPVATLSDVLIMSSESISTSAHGILHHVIDVCWDLYISKQETLAANWAIHDSKFILGHWMPTSTSMIPS